MNCLMLQARALPELQPLAACQTEQAIIECGSPYLSRIILCYSVDHAAVKSICLISAFPFPSIIHRNTSAVGGCGAYQLLGIPQHYFTERGTDITTLLPDIGTLRDKLCETAGIATMVQTVDDYFLAIFNNNKKRLRDMQRAEYACQLIFSHMGILTIKELLTKLHTTKSRLNEDFQTIVGIPPKALSRIVRYNTILHRMQRIPVLSYSEIIYDANYYDQAHFIKEFRNFSGVTPGKKDILENNLCAHLSQLCLPDLMRS